MGSCCALSAVTPPSRSSTRSSRWGTPLHHQTARRGWFDQSAWSRRACHHSARALVLLTKPPCHVPASAPWHLGRAVTLRRRCGAPPATGPSEAHHGARCELDAAQPKLSGCSRAVSVRGSGTTFSGEQICNHGWGLGGKRCGTRAFVDSETAARCVWGELGSDLLGPASPLKGPLAHTAAECAVAGTCMPGRRRLGPAERICPVRSRHVPAENSTSLIPHVPMPDQMNR